ncbi:MAG: deoxyribose-phosphate aldolase [Conexivisphaerales archaeon]
MVSKADLAGMIEHTLLTPSADFAAVKRLCEEAKRYSFYGVVVNPYFVKYCKELLRDTGIKVISVIAFPFGATYSEVKAAEAGKAIQDGADELDMVMNIGAAKSNDWEFVKRDIQSVSSVTKKYGKALKVIIEAGVLTEQEKIKACRIAMEAGADFVKSSTGFSGVKTTANDIKTMSEAVDHRIGVKAAGGIRTAREALAMIEAGATRIGSSHSVEIIETFNGQEQAIASLGQKR